MISLNHKFSQKNTNFSSTFPGFHILPFWELVHARHCWSWSTSDQIYHMSRTHILVTWLMSIRLARLLTILCSNFSSKCQQGRKVTKIAIALLSLYPSAFKKYPANSFSYWPQSKTSSKYWPFYCSLQFIHTFSCRHHFYIKQRIVRIQ